MAAINEVSFRGIEQYTKNDAAVREFVRGLIWQWIEAHAEDRVKLHIWIFHKDFRIKELYRVFELILGERPIFVPA